MPIQKITSGIIDGTTTFANTAISGTITASQIAAVNANTITSGTIPLAQVPQLSAAKLPTGSVLQVLSSTQTSTQALTGTSTWTDLSNLSVSITPTSATSKILIFISVNVQGINNAYFRLLRNSTVIGVGDTAGSVSRVTIGNGYYNGQNSSQTTQLAAQFLDSPATTSAITYKAQGYADGGSQTGTLYINYANAEQNAPSSSRAISTITVMEITA
jgi:hypothetical protein